MNIKLLRKLRKRYKWYWDKDPHWEDILWVLDMKKQETRLFNGVRNFLLDWVYSHFGIATGFRYAQRLDKREARAKFREKLKHLTHKSPQ
jgi:hypothetical protein